MSDKPCFAPIPARAIADPDLSGLDLRTLALIARHDGFNRNGRGCFASHRTMAARLGANEKSVARSIARLVDAGYLRAENQGRDGRLRVYFVHYTDEDHAAFRGDGRTHAPRRPLEPVRPEISNRSVTELDRELGSGSVTDRALPDARSVTEAEEIGNRNAIEKLKNAKPINGLESRIYSTKVGIDSAEAVLGEVERGATALRVIAETARGKRPSGRKGPANDAEAEIDAAMRRRGVVRPGEPISIIEPEVLRDARPTEALLKSRFGPKRGAA